jgi:hypothetical protein
MLYATPGPGFVGHLSIFQFVNDDGADKVTACGQAAIATVLANRRRIPKTSIGLQAVEKAYPADVLSGTAGTSPNRVKRALTDKGLDYFCADERKGLEDALRRKFAAVALIQNSAGLAGMGDGAHWFVVFGCDINGVHVTNYGASPFISWSTFDELWSSPISVIGGMGKRVICS